MKKFYTFLVLITCCTMGFSQYHYNRAAHFADSSYYESVVEGDFDFTGAITIEAWIKPDSIPYYAGIVGKNYTTGYYFGITNTGVLRFVRAGDFVEGTAIIPSNEWTHVAVTYDGVSTVNFYVNGAPDPVSSGSAVGAIPNVADPFRIGCDQEGGVPEYFFYGSIDEVRIWDAVLSGAQINSHKHIPLGIDYASGIYIGTEESFRMNITNPADTIYSEVWPYHQLTPHNITSINYTNQTSAYSDYNSHLVFDGNGVFNINDNFAATDMFLGKSITAEVWVRMDNTLPAPGSFMNIFNQSGGATEYPFGLYADAITGQVYFELNQAAMQLFGGAINDNLWHHLAGTFSDTTGHMELFIDGELIDSTTYDPMSNNINQSTYDYYLGSIGASSFVTNRLVGGVDEARLWKNVVRTQAEIKSCMYRGLDASINDPDIDSLVVFGLDGITRESNYDINDQLPNFYGVFGGASPPVFASSKMNINSNPTSPLLRLDPNNYPVDFKMQRLGIPITDMGMVTDTINVGGINLFVDPSAVEVALLVNHPSISDVSVWLFNATNDSVQLVSSASGGCDGNDIMTVFSMNTDSTYSNDCTVDNMVPFSPIIKPENPLNPLYLDNPNGGWRLKIFDEVAGNTGFWHAWGLRVVGAYIGIDELPTLSFPSYNFPNPFDETTTIYFELPKQDDLKLNVFDQYGRVIRQEIISDATNGANYYQITLGGLSSGVYYYELISGEYRVVHKMIVR